MNREQSDLLMASQTCGRCNGTGRNKKLGKDTIDAVSCRCVFIGIFRECHRRFRQCNENPKHLSVTSLVMTHGVNASRSFGRKNEEYLADFTLISARVLGRGTREHWLFTLRYLQGADPSLIQRRMGITGEEYRNTDARVIEKLGRAFRDTKPYSLFPLDEYFSSGMRQDYNPPANGPATPATRAAPLFRPIRAPLAPAPRSAPMAA
ncbi:MAG: hypothetical protein ABSG41_26640 [Bryobacteraceae bacterium]|jgi:hypothetical protein